MMAKETEKLVDTEKATEPKQAKAGKVYRAKLAPYLSSGRVIVLSVEGVHEGVTLEANPDPSLGWVEVSKGLYDYLNANNEDLVEDAGKRPSKKYMLETA